MPATHAGPLRTMPQMRDVPSEVSVAANSSKGHVEQITMLMEEQLPESRKVRSNGNDSSKSVGNHDVAEVHRANVADSVRSKFNDVFEASTVNCNILDESDLSKVSEVNVACRLNRPESVRFFESINAPSNILKTLREGHHSSFHSFVPPLERKNNGSFYKHEQWAVQEVKNLISLGKVEVVQSKPYCVLPLHVVVQPNKTRLILDCTMLNEYIITPKFKMDDYKVALNFFKAKGWLIVYDY